MQRRNTEAQRHRGAKLRWWGIRLLLTVILAGVALVLVPRARGFTLADAEAFIGAALPESAANVQFATRDEFARVVWLRFTLPPETDITPFVQAMGLPVEVREAFSPFPAQNYTETELTWWTPYTATDFGGLHTIHADKVYDLLLDHTDPATPVMYLRAYGL